MRITRVCRNEVIKVNALIASYIGYTIHYHPLLRKICGRARLCMTAPFACFHKVSERDYIHLYVSTLHDLSFHVNCAIEKMSPLPAKCIIVLASLLEQGGEDTFCIIRPMLYLFIFSNLTSPSFTSSLEKLPALNAASLFLMSR